MLNGSSAGPGFSISTDTLNAISDDQDPGVVRTVTGVGSFGINEKRSLPVIKSVLVLSVPAGSNAGKLAYAALLDRHLVLSTS